jgi:hypothetical protein
MVPDGWSMVAIVLNEMLQLKNHDELRTCFDIEEVFCGSLKSHTV